MEITEVKVILKEGPDRKLKAYATITFDNCFVVRNIKVIKGTKGLFVAMPSRKMRESCPKCNYKNAMRSRFCNMCGASLPVEPQRPVTDEIKPSEHRDIAHPITLECREYIQKKVLEAYDAELKRGGAPSEEPKYAPPEPRPAKRPVETPKPVEEKEPTADESGDIEL